MIVNHHKNVTHKLSGMFLRHLLQSALGFTHVLVCCKMKMAVLLTGLDQSHSLTGSSLRGSCRTVKHHCYKQITATVLYKMCFKSPHEKINITVILKSQCTFIYLWALYRTYTVHSQDFSPDENQQWPQLSGWALEQLQHVGKDPHRQGLKAHKALQSVSWTWLWNMPVKVWPLRQDGTWTVQETEKGRESTYCKVQAGSMSFTCAVKLG